MDDSTEQFLTIFFGLQEQLHEIVYSHKNIEQFQIKATPFMVDIQKKHGTKMLLYCTKYCLYIANKQIQKFDEEDLCVQKLKEIMLKYMKHTVCDAEKCNPLKFNEEQQKNKKLMEIIVVEAFSNKNHPQKLDQWLGKFFEMIQKDSKDQQDQIEFYENMLRGFYTDIKGICGI